MTDKLYLDDISVGDTFVTDELAISAADIVEFASQFDPQVFHLDAEAAKDTFFRGLAASGWHTAAITMRLLVTSGMPLADGMIGAGGEVSWPSATRPGDVLHVEATVTDVRPSSSKPNQGLITVRSETMNADREVRQLLVAKLLVFRRPAE